jgi:hypothetical protein
MFASVLGLSAQQAAAHPTRPPALAAELCVGRGVFTSQSGLRSAREREWPEAGPGEPFLMTDEIQLADSPTPPFMVPDVKPAPSALLEAPAVPRSPQEPPAPHRDVSPFLMAIHGLIESDQLTAARRLLDATPARVRCEPAFVKLRFLLSPPVVKTSHRQDADRAQEYAWLRAQGHTYRGCWVALAGNTLLASARTLRELRSILKDIPMGSPPLLHRVD